QKYRCLRSWALRCAWAGACSVVRGGRRGRPRARGRAGGGAAAGAGGGARGGGGVRPAAARPRAPARPGRAARTPPPADACLARRGIEVDVYTRQREHDHPKIQEIAPGARVIHIESGPVRYLAKMDVYDRLDEFTAGVDAHVAEQGLRYDLIHSHYWLSAEVARVLAPKWGVPRIQMFHTLGLVKREVMDEDVDAESDVRIEIERRAVRESAAVVAA